MGIARKMLDQRAAVIDIKQLMAAADRQHRQIAVERFTEQIHFHAVARQIRLLRFGSAFLPITLGIDVAAAGNQQTVETFERPWLVRRDEHRLEPYEAQRIGIRASLLRVLMSPRLDGAHLLFWVSATEIS